MERHEAIELLSLNLNFTDAELKSRFKSLIMKNHPDKFNRSENCIFEIQEEITKKLIVAYKVLSNNPSDFQNELFPNVKFDFSTLINIDSSDKTSNERVKVHPNHRDESFRNLWAEIHNIESTGNLFLASELWNLSIVFLLKDLKKYPDIDGILHNYIRDYSKLLIKIGHYKEAFDLIQIAILTNVKSYYGFYPPSILLYRAISMTYRIEEALNIWKNQFLLEGNMFSILVQWAMSYALHLNHDYISLFNAIESGCFFPYRDSKLLTYNYSDKNEIILTGPFDFINFSGSVKNRYLKENVITSTEADLYRFQIINILIAGKNYLQINNFSKKFKLTDYIIKSVDASILKKKKFALANKFGNYRGLQGEIKISSPETNLKPKAEKIFKRYVRNYKSNLLGNRAGPRKLDNCVR